MKSEGKGITLKFITYKSYITQHDHIVLLHKGQNDERSHKALHQTWELKVANLEISYTKFSTYNKIYKRQIYTSLINNHYN